MLEKHPLVILQPLLAKHVEGSCIPQLRGLFQQISRHHFIGLHPKTVPVHVGEVDHGVRVLPIIGLHEVFVCLFVGSFDGVGDAVEIDGAQVDHRIGVAHLRGFKIAAHCQLPILLDPVSAEITVAYLVLGGSVVALRRFNEI